MTEIDVKKSQAQPPPNALITKLMVRLRLHGHDCYYAPETDDRMQGGTGQLVDFMWCDECGGVWDAACAPRTFDEPCKGVT